MSDAFLASLKNDAELMRIRWRASFPAWADAWLAARVREGKHREKSIGPGLQDAFDRWFASLTSDDFEIVDHDAAEHVWESFDIDEGFSGVNTPEDAVRLCADGDCACGACGEPYDECLYCLSWQAFGFEKNEAGELKLTSRVRIRRT